ncbi:HEAT repeat domain-containing protein [Chloroflexus sp. MS-CIW-1]|jgi:HEAT repeat protein|uniref:HEAT repeat domain-containing protein n=1 Tax=unclassified Chloroflexus TaxID=2633855 RepID=UPI0004DED068|nr:MULTISPECIES: HEAT repeat domain-containing protein [unclassified Chloroflexus]MBO9312401.1 HEAT repeat domain-containing protein [Chloroflexus sp.]MBO9347922.1 HEAT repeat domain-containing protein [Chloroflexus sp.]MBO9373718.1 HEAT repeat domain-containing protein [Chloroflexus sp.]MDN5273740.1 HEAT repeat domain-containing protein [Chloroflexus sp. MS-CIW-1]
MTLSFAERVAQLDTMEKAPTRLDLKLLANLGPESVYIFWEQWQRFSLDRRRHIMRLLAELAEEQIQLDYRPVFRACLADQDAQIRVLAIEGLWEDDHEQMMDRLIQMLHDPAGEVRAAALLSLARFAYRAEIGDLSLSAGQRLHDVLVEAATDPDQPFEVRRRAIEALGYFAESSAAQELVDRAYNTDDIYMRESAVLAMGRSMRRQWFPYILRELQSPSPSLRYEAARAVGEIGEDGRELLPALLPLVDDEDTEIALAAIWALGQVGGADARRILQRIARSRDEVRAQVAQDALAELDLDTL